MSIQVPEEHSHPYPAIQVSEERSHPYPSHPPDASHLASGPPTRMPVISALTSLSTASKAAMVLSLAWLLTCLAIGVSIILPHDIAAPDLPSANAEVVSRSFRTSYGGDAYTGIQNAASDTERAVVEAANHAQVSARAIEKWRADFQADALAQVAGPLRMGVGSLVIASGVLPLVVSLSSIGRRGSEYGHRRPNATGARDG